MTADTERRIARELALLGKTTAMWLDLRDREAVSVDRAAQAVAVLAAAARPLRLALRECWDAEAVTA